MRSDLLVLEFLPDALDHHGKAVLLAVVTLDVEPRTLGGIVHPVNNAKLGRSRLHDHVDLAMTQPQFLLCSQDRLTRLNEPLLAGSESQLHLGHFLERTVAPQKTQRRQRAHLRRLQALCRSPRRWRTIVPEDVMLTRRGHATGPRWR